MIRHVGDIEEFILSIVTNYRKRRRNRRDQNWRKPLDIPIICRASKAAQDPNKD
jgi:hypothetical protein